MADDMMAKELQRKHDYFHFHKKMRMVSKLFKKCSSIEWTHYTQYLFNDDREGLERIIEDSTTRLIVLESEVK